MSATEVEHEVTIWMLNEAPVRMVYAGQRWRVTDTPTRLRDSIWVALERLHGLYGWRFQATNERGESFVFDVFRAENDWHVHRAYA